MAKYLIQANYVGQGIKGLLQDGGSARRAAVEKLAQSMGASIESFYYAFGDYDLVMIVDVPDHASMASIVLTVNAGGAVTAKTTVLLTPEEIDAAGKMSPVYSAPGA